jgi:hypothetical protein
VFPELEIVGVTDEPSMVITKVPVGVAAVEVFVTVAVKLTESPKNEGFFEDVNVVVVGAFVIVRLAPT